LNQNLPKRMLFFGKIAKKLPSTGVCHQTLVLLQSADFVYFTVVPSLFVICPSTLAGLLEMALVWVSYSRSL